MAQNGGYRRPSNPAAASGPGALSQRTDGQPVMEMTGGEYGEGVDLRSIQQGATMAKAQLTAPGGAANGSAGPPQTGFSDPGDPNIPITSGAAAGPGPGPESLGIHSDPGERTRQDIRSMQPILPALIAAAQAPDASPELKRYVRRIIASS